MTKVAKPLPAPWGELPLAPGDEHDLELGTLRLTLRRAAGEVWLRMHRAPAGDPEDAPWRRWAVRSGSHVEVRPAAPDRLLVVSHEYDYHLPPEGESRIFVRIPLFVQVLIVGGDTEVVAADVPSIVLSDTWWGDFTEGELAYWLTTKARVELSDDLFLPHFGMCPLRLVNDSAAALPVERFAVRVAHLSLFATEGRNWTDQVRVRYEESPEGSEIRFAGEAPAEAGRAALIARPRVPVERGFRAKTFDRLRSLSSLGI
jgi:hypothetical protein